MLFPLKCMYNIYPYRIMLGFFPAQWCPKNFLWIFLDINTILLLHNAYYLTWFCTKSERIQVNSNFSGFVLLYLFVWLFVYSQTSNFPAIWRLSPLPVTGCKLTPSYLWLSPLWKRLKVSWIYFHKFMQHIFYIVFHMGN